LAATSGLAFADFGVLAGCGVFGGPCSRAAKFYQDRMREHFELELVDYEMLLEPPLVLFGFLHRFKLAWLSWFWAWVRYF